MYVQTCKTLANKRFENKKGRKSEILRELEIYTRKKEEKGIKSIGPRLLENEQHMVSPFRSCFHSSWYSLTDT